MLCIPEFWEVFSGNVRGLISKEPLWKRWFYRAARLPRWTQKVVLFKRASDNRNVNFLIKKYVFEHQTINPCLSVWIENLTSFFSHLLPQKVHAVREKSANISLPIISLPMAQLHLETQSINNTYSYTKAIHHAFPRSSRLSEKHSSLSKPAALSHRKFEI